MGMINIALIGVGNCASSLLQGIEYYRGRSAEEAIGLMHWNLGGYTPADIRVVAAWDVDRRKIGSDVHAAVFAKPNCTTVFCPEMPMTGTLVRMGKILDSVSDHMKDFPEEQTYLVGDGPQPSKKEIIDHLRQTKTDVLLNYLPVGSQQATEFYAECALEAGVAFVNNIPIFIASNSEWRKRFETAKIPIIGDDLKAQLGSTIIHRVITELCGKRGVSIDRTYQLNTGGNTDFLNMLNRARLASKKISKTEAVQSTAASRLAEKNIHIGPSDYVAWQNDNKVCFMRIEGRMFGGVPYNMELRLSVEDSPNSAGVAIDSIRCCKLALDRGFGGALYSASAYFCKHPPKQFAESEASQMTLEFIAGKRAD